MTVSRWRLLAGGAVAAAVVGAVALLAPPYFDNWELSRALATVVERQHASGWSDEQWRVAAAEQAARLGIPVRSEQVQLTRRGQAVRVEARYQIRVDFGAYTVNLHLRARGGAF